mgnify:FL=1
MPGFELFGEEERKEVNEVLETGILMRYGFDAQRQNKWKSKELEQAICDTFKVNHAQLVSSGTAALTTAMAALGIGYGDEVIMPTFTFVASFEAVLSVGAVPILVNINETLTLDPKAVEAAITPKTKAIMPVHMCGAMADLDALKNICTQHNLLLLEDACQATGGSYKGQSLGTIGDAGTFSFDFVKTITTAEGGAVITNNKETYEKCDMFSDHGHDHLGGADRGADLHPFLGYNFRISELHAAVGLAQIRKLDQFLAIQKKNKKVLKDSLQATEKVTFRVLPDPEGDNASFLSFFMENEEQAIKVSNEMKAQGIPAFHWYHNNWHYIRKWDHLKTANGLYRFSPEQTAALEALQTRDFSQSDAIMSRCIATPIALSWSDEETQRRANVIAEIVKNA